MRGNTICTSQEELCRPCFFFVLRSLLGDDDATIQEQGRALRSELWHPVIDDALAGVCAAWVVWGRREEGEEQAVMLCQLGVQRLHTE